MRDLTLLVRNAVRSIAARRGRAQTSTARLCGLIARLTDDTGRVVTLHKVYDLAIPEIASRLHLSERAVEQHRVTAALLIAGSIDLDESARCAGICRAGIAASSANTVARSADRATGRT